MAMVERVIPDARRLELFCRKPRPGWTSWGNEVTDEEAETDLFGGVA
jgi:N6-adenosine-specific RNA methylase IME4